MKRKKVIKLMVYACSIALISYLVYITYYMVGYLNGVKTDIIHKQTMAKSFLTEYNFSGKITNKYSYKKNKNDLSFYISITLSSNIQLPTFPYDSHYNEYTFDKKNRTLKIRVSKEIYEQANKNTTVTKLSHSDAIFLDGKRYLLFGKKEYEWIP